jgi:hypothetical protein
LATYQGGSQQPELWEALDEALENSDKEGIFEILRILKRGKE